MLAGVFQMESTQAIPASELKDKYLALLKAQDKTFGYIVRGVRSDGQGGAGGPGHRLDREGHARRQGDAGARHAFRRVSPMAFRDLAEASKERAVFSYRAGATAAVSVIAPSLIFEELEIQRIRDILQKPPVVPSPLNKVTVDLNAESVTLEYPTIFGIDFLAHHVTTQAGGVMRMLTRLLLSAAAVALLGGAPLIAQTKATAENVPTIPHTSVPNFFKLPPDLYLGEGIGIATNSKGHVFVYHRSGDTRLFEFDPNGNFVKEWGVGLYGIEFAHQVRVDPQDNVWVVDEGTNMVIKFNPAGRVVMVLGRRPEPVAGATPTRHAGRPGRSNKKYQFGRPTDVAWDPQGNIFVSDGYVNSRVVKYDKNGRFIAQFAGERGARAEPAEHAAFDRRRTRRATSTSAIAATAASWF